MTEFWVSKAKYYCQECKTWMADNKSVRQYHESSEKHKANVERHLAQIHRRQTEKTAEEEKLKRELLRIEQAAGKAYRRDLVYSHQAVSNPTRAQSNVVDESGADVPRPSYYASDVYRDSEIDRVEAFIRARTDAMVSVGEIAPDDIGLAAMREAAVEKEKLKEKERQEEKAKRRKQALKWKRQRVDSDDGVSDNDKEKEEKEEKKESKPVFQTESEAAKSGKSSKAGAAAVIGAWKTVAVNEFDDDSDGDSDGGGGDGDDGAQDYPPDEPAGEGEDGDGDEGAERGPLPDNAAAARRYGDKWTKAMYRADSSMARQLAAAPSSTIIPSQKQGERVAVSFGFKKRKAPSSSSIRQHRS